MTNTRRDGELERQLRLTTSLLDARRRASLPSYAKVTADLARELVRQNRELLEVEGAIGALAEVTGVRIERNGRDLADWLRQIAQVLALRAALPLPAEDDDAPIKIRYVRKDRASAASIALTEAGIPHSLINGDPDYKFMVPGGWEMQADRVFKQSGSCRKTPSLVDTDEDDTPPWEEPIDETG